MSPLKKACVIHLDAETKALADLGAARKKLSTKGFISQLIRDEIKRVREIERQKREVKN